MTILPLHLPIIFMAQAMVMNSVDSIFFPSLFSLLTDYWGGWNGTRFSTWRGCRLLDGTPWKCTVCDVIAIDAFSFCLTYSLPLVFWSCLLMIIAFDVKTLIVVQSEPLFVCLWSLLVITFWVLPFLFVPSTLWFLLTHKFLTHVRIGLCSFWRKKYEVPILAEFF